MQFSVSACSARMIGGLGVAVLVCFHSHQVEGASLLRGLIVHAPPYSDLTTSYIRGCARELSGPESIRLDFWECLRQFRRLEGVCTTHPIALMHFCRLFPSFCETFIFSGPSPTPYIGMGCAVPRLATLVHPVQSQREHWLVYGVSQAWTLSWFICAFFSCWLWRSLRDARCASVFVRFDTFCFDLHCSDSRRSRAGLTHLLERQLMPNREKMKQYADHMVQHVQLDERAASM